MKNLIAEDLPNLEKSAMEILQNFCQLQMDQVTSRDCEKELTKLLDSASEESSNISTVSFLVQNRFTICFGVRLSQETNAEETDKIKK